MSSLVLLFTRLPCCFVLNISRHFLLEHTYQGLTLPCLLPCHCTSYVWALLQPFIFAAECYVYPAESILHDSPGPTGERVSIVPRCTFDSSRFLTSSLFFQASGTVPLMQRFPHPCFSTQASPSTQTSFPTNSSICWAHSVYLASTFLFCSYLQRVSWTSSRVPLSPLLQGPASLLYAPMVLFTGFCH